MTLATRCGMVGIGALAILSLAQWVRGGTFESTPILAYVLGVLPNLAAAVAIPFVSMAGWLEVYRLADPGRHQRTFLLWVAFGTVGLVIWELVQRGGNLVFDPHDIAATMVGAVAAFVIFQMVAPGALAGSARKSSAMEDGRR